MHDGQTRLTILQQLLNLAYISSDPEIVAQAWPAISQARQEAEQLKSKLFQSQAQNNAQLAVMAMQAGAAVQAAEADASVVRAQAQAANVAAEARVEATERMASTAVQAAKARARSAEESASAQVQATDRGDRRPGVF